MIIFVITHYLYFAEVDTEIATNKSDSSTSFDAIDKGPSTYSQWLEGPSINIIRLLVVA